MIDTLISDRQINILTVIYPRRTDADHLSKHIQYSSPRTAV